MSCQNVSTKKAGDFMKTLLVALSAVFIFGCAPSQDRTADDLSSPTGETTDHESHGHMMDKMNHKHMMEMHKDCMAEHKDVKMCDQSMMKAKAPATSDSEKK
jgi:hypothetical protein